MEALAYYFLPIVLLTGYFCSLQMFFKMLEKHDNAQWEILGKPSIFNLGILNGIQVLKTLAFSTFRKSGVKEINTWGHVSQLTLVITFAVCIALAAHAPAGIYS